METRSGKTANYMRTVMIQTIRVTLTTGSFLATQANRKITFFITSTLKSLAIRAI